jgi:methyltransferase (TIGR00027 family)
MQANSVNIIQTGEPSRSALRVATARAAHQLLDEPIVFVDPVALPVLGKKMEEKVRDDPFQFNDPMSRGMRAAMVVRSRLAEDELALAVAAGVRQYVVLGAGLDTFAFRNLHAGQGLKVFEVDHPSTQVWKQANLAEASIAIPDSMRFVAVDFEKDSLADRLQQAGFRSDQPAYFSWLGVALYLNKEAIFNTLKFVASLPAGSAITFDYLVERSLLQPIERVINEMIAQTFADMGESWISYFKPDELAAELGRIGFGSLADVGAKELNARYLARRKDGLQAGNGARLMCAKK